MIINRLIRDYSDWIFPNVNCNKDHNVIYEHLHFEPSDQIYSQTLRHIIAYLWHQHKHNSTDLINSND